VFLALAWASPPKAVTSTGPFPSVVPAKAGTQTPVEGQVWRPGTRTGFPLSRE
jgi:hypothetical protein